jgi:NADH:quinone reductase (non-electrogenic)
MDTSHEHRERVSNTHLPRVVIVGGGFGGLYAARGSNGRQSPSRSLTSTTTTSFGQCSTRSRPVSSSNEVAAPIRSILRRQKNVTVLMAEVVYINQRVCSL